MKLYMLWIYVAWRHSDRMTSFWETDRFSQCLSVLWLLFEQILLLFQAYISPFRWNLQQNSTKTQSSYSTRSSPITRTVTTSPQERSKCRPAERICSSSPSRTMQARQSTWRYTGKQMEQIIYCVRRMQASTLWKVFHFFHFTRNGNVSIDVQSTTEFFRIFKIPTNVDMRRVKEQIKIVVIYPVKSFYNSDWSILYWLVFEIFFINILQMFSRNSMENHDWKHFVFSTAIHRPVIIL